ncbi:hypothetical protein B5F12_09065 [Pseudoflavonifractor sp. An176]|nr:hypothetical protein B5F12_09065 [Pseudoflavonifractor sp. An176]
MGPNSKVQISYGKVRVFCLHFSNCFCKNNLAFIIGDIVSASIPDTPVNMDIRFTSARISGKHKQIIYSCISKALYPIQNDFQQFRVGIISEFSKGVDIKTLQVCCNFIAYLFFGNAAKLLMITHDLIRKIL